MNMNNEQAVREYCRAEGYVYERLVELLDEDEVRELHESAKAWKEGTLLDGFLAFPRYEWRSAMIDLE